ncbi:MAG: GAF domain-containing protein [Mycobacterium sp.]
MEATEEGQTGGEGTLADRDISHTLHLADRFAELLPVNGASIVVRSGPDNTQLVHATDDVVAQLDELQFTLGEGPCLDAFRQREPVLVADLGSTDAFARWPGFAHEATQAGAFAAFAFPLQLGTAPFGTVELYRDEPGELSERDTAIALLIVDELVSVVLDDLTGAGSPARPQRRESSSVVRACRDPAGDRDDSCAARRLHPRGVGATSGGRFRRAPPDSRDRRGRHRPPAGVFARSALSWPGSAAEERPADS